MKLDKDIILMTDGDRGKEIQRLRKLIRTHKLAEGNARCWRNDIELYEHTLPEGAEGAGRMDLPRNVLLGNCARYIDRQQCSRGTRPKSRI